MLELADTTFTGVQGNEASALTEGPPTLGSSGRGILRNLRLRQRAEMRRAIGQIAVIVVDDEAQTDGVDDVGRIGRRSAEHQPCCDGVPDLPPRRSA